MISFIICAHWNIGTNKSRRMRWTEHVARKSYCGENHQEGIDVDGSERNMI
jgi:hypothetical protein